MRQGRKTRMATQDGAPTHRLDDHIAMVANNLSKAGQENAMICTSRRPLPPPPKVPGAERTRCKARKPADDASASIS